MKQILTYISLDKEFNEEHKMAAKIQIDNSLSLGWKSEDIMLVTNFEYEYNGIKSIVIEDNNYCKRHWPTTKIYVILALFKKDLIKDNELYWYHDFDCFELNKIKEKEVLEEIKGYDIGLSNYGQCERLCSASIFFNKNAEDIFQWVKNDVDNGRKDEERSFMRLYYNKDNSIGERIKRVNTTYAFHKFNIIPTYKTTIKPVKVVHFHLTPDKYEFYVEGKNKLNMSLIPERLINIFNKNGFTR